MRAFKNILLTSTIVALASIPAAAHAQAANADEVSSDEDAFGGITVTARRREESLQSVPVAVTAVTAEQLREKQIVTPYDLVGSVPGLNATSGGATRNDVQFFIRGQGTTFGSSPSVVTYFADVPQYSNPASGGSNATFYDLESVQVLKGPQGTLFGRPTTGGAVLLTPHKPTGDFDGFAEASYGNYNAIELTGAINVPIVGDKVALRVAGNFSKHDGFTRSVTNNQELDDRNRWSIRAGLMLRPTEGISNYLLFQHNDIDENGTANVLNYFNPDFPLLNAGGIAAVQQVCGGAAFLGLLPAAQVPNCIAVRAGAIADVKAGLAGEYARLQAATSKSERRRPATGGFQYLRSRTQQVINTTEIDFGELGLGFDVSLKNIFAASRNLRSDTIREIMGSPVPTGVVYNDLNFINGQPIDDGRGKTKWGDVWSEEIQLFGQIAGRHDWIAGYFTETNKRSQYLNWVSQFSTYNGAFTFYTNSAGQFQIDTLGYPAISNNIFSDYLLKSEGVFAQTTIDMGDFGLDGLKFTGGYRKSWITNSLTDVPSTLITDIGIIPVPGGVPLTASVKQRASTYTLSLDYQVTPDVLAYISHRKGFKQGGLNFQSIRAAANGLPGVQASYAPEKVNDYEFGIKADWYLGGARGRTNIAIYQADFSNQQKNGTYVNERGGISTQITNIAKSRIRGLELENLVQVSDNFQFGFSYSYIDPKYVSFPGTITDVFGVAIPRTETPFTGISKHQLAVNSQISKDLGDAGQLKLTSSLTFKSKYWTNDSAVLNPEERIRPDQTALALLSARLDWENVGGMPLDIGLFGRNLTNKLYVVGSGGLYGDLGTTTRIYGDPRTYGLQIRVRFGESAN